MIDLKTKDDVYDQILFELICLSAEVPTEDQETSIGIITTLSELPADVSNVLLISGLQLFGRQGGYDQWKNMYAESLIANGKEELALELNDRAVKNFK